MSDIVQSSNTSKLFPIDIEQEVKQSYTNYAMSVIVSRAIPEARDGLKPVHRRILYSMFEQGLRHNSEPKKVAKVLGGVLGNYHPHGQDSVYNALVRLAQDFSLRYPLVIGQGNFGSIDGDPPAAYRYTETKLAPISEEMLADIRKNTVDFMPNYDETQQEPTVLPAALPSLLINGATGIAVGFTTEIPPHNLKEIAEAVVTLVDNSDTTDEALYKIVRGPDFPTGSIICGTKNIIKAYKYGRGQIILQARHTIETHNEYERIVFLDVPYAKRKAELVLGLAEQVNNESIPDVRDIRDESNRDGIRVVVELKKGANTHLILQRIFTLTGFQSSYNMNFVALVKGRPQTLSLKQMLQIYIDHRKEVIERKTQFELDEAEARIHIVRGLIIALHDIDTVVALIKQSKNTETAKQALVSHFKIDDIQAKAILDMQLHRLTSLEVQKLENEKQSLETLIASLQDLLASPQKIREVIKKTILEIAEKHGDERKTEIQEKEALSVSEEELIDKEDVVITLTESGYIKRTTLDTFGLQRRGGKGKIGVSLSKDDETSHVYVGNTHDSILFITSKGRSFIIKTYQIPSATRTSRGQSIKTLLNMENNETISSLLYAPSFENSTADTSLILATAQGKIKKVKWSTLSNAVSRRGIRTITLKENDMVVGGIVTHDIQDVFMFSAQGRLLRFHSKALRSMGRTAGGVGGMRLKKQDKIIGVHEGDDESSFVLLTETGFGKRLLAKHIHPHGRNTGGVVCIGISEKTGALTIALPVQEKGTITSLTKKGKTLRVDVEQCPIQGRTARGVSIVTTDENDTLKSATMFSSVEK